jgi:hypothetical protein
MYEAIMINIPRLKQLFSALQLQNSNCISEDNISFSLRSDEISTPSALKHSLSLPAFLYRVSQEGCAILREGVPYVKIYRYNPKHLCPKLNGYGDNGQRSLKL